jgi:hypothetical protein
MPNWGPMDWLAYITLYLAAFILAIVQGSRDMTSPSWLPNIFFKIPWSYIPLFLLLITTGIFLSKQFGWIGSSPKKADRTTLSQQDWNKIPKTAIVGKTFAHENVVLDGHSYNKCTFIKVTFVYNGTAPFDLIDCKIEKPYLVASSRPNIEAYFVLLKELGYISPDKRIINME